VPFIAVLLSWVWENSHSTWSSFRGLGQNGKRYFHEHPHITCAELYEYACQLARERGREYGGPIAGHLIGVFPHEKISGDKVTLYVHPDNPNRMRTLDANGRKRHWILEIHFVDRAREIGGFYEELLTI